MRERSRILIRVLIVSVICCISAQQTQCEKRFDPKQITFGPIAETEPNISPDGRWLAFQYFVKNRPGLVHIWIMEISKGFTSARGLVTQVDYAGEMSWSPDSKWISFISSENRPARKTNQIYKVSVQTNELFQITAFPEGTLIGDSTTWSANGLIGFEKEGIIYGVSPTGGNEVQLLDTRTALSNQRPSYIRFSPDGKMMVFSAENAEQNQSSLWLGDLQSRTIRRLTDLHFDLYPTWIDEGHVLFTRQNKNKWSQIEVLSLGTGHLNQITFKHLDLTPSANPSGNVLYFSRKGPAPKGLENTDFFVGFHIWRVAIPSKVVR